MSGPAPTDLLGTWTFDRTIDDRFGDERLTVSGTTVLSSTADGRVRWAERGTMRRGAQETPVSRELFVEPRDGGWFVTFSDGRDFHPWAPGEDVVHPCGSDTYRGQVESCGAREWRVVWNVSGPAKDYTMVTVLTR